MDDPGPQEMSLAAMVEYMEQHPHVPMQHQQEFPQGQQAREPGAAHYDGIDPALQGGVGRGGQGHDAGAGFGPIDPEEMRAFIAEREQARAQYLRHAAQQQQQQHGHLYAQQQQHQQQQHRPVYSPNAQYNPAYSPSPAHAPHPHPHPQQQQSYGYDSTGRPVLPSASVPQQQQFQQPYQDPHADAQQMALLEYVRQQHAAGAYANEEEGRADAERYLKALQASMPPVYDPYAAPSDQQYHPSPSASAHANAAFHQDSRVTSSSANDPYQQQQHQHSGDAGSSADQQADASRGRGRPKGSLTKMKQEPSDDDMNGGSQAGEDEGNGMDPNAIRKTGRPKGSKNKAKDGEDDGTGETMAKKPRGRPKGSKNKPKGPESAAAPKPMKGIYPNPPLIPPNQFIAVNLAGNAPVQAPPQIAPHDPFLAPGSNLSGDHANPFNLAPLPPVYIHHPPMAFPSRTSTYNIFPQHHPPMALVLPPGPAAPTSYTAPRRGRPPGSKDKGPRRSKTTGELLGQWKVKKENGGEEEYEKIEKAKRPRGRPRGSGASSRAKRSRDTSDEDDDDDEGFDEVVTGGRRDGEAGEGGEGSANPPTGRPKREVRRAAVAAVAAVKAFVEPKPKRVRRVKAEVDPNAPVIPNPLAEGGIPAPPVLGPDGLPLPVDPNAPLPPPVVPAEPILGPDGLPLPIDPLAVPAPAPVYEEFDELESSDEFDDQDDSEEDSDYQEKRRVKREDSEPEPLQFDAEGNPIEKKRRGRPPGSKNKKAVKSSNGGLDSDGESADGAKGRGKRKRGPPQAFGSNPLLPHLARESSAAASSAGTPPLDAAYPPGMAPAKRGRGRPKKPVADLAESTRRRRMGEGRFLEGRDEIAYGIFDGDGKPGVGGGGIAAGPGAGGGGLEVGVADDLKMLRGLLGGGASANAEASGSGSNGAQGQQQLPSYAMNEALQNLSSSGALANITQDQFFQAAGNDADQAMQLAQALLLQAQAQAQVQQQSSASAVAPNASGNGGDASAEAMVEGGGSGDGETPWMSAFLTEIQGLQPEAGGSNVEAGVTGAGVEGQGQQQQAQAGLVGGPTEEEQMGAEMMAILAGGEIGEGGADIQAPQ